MGERVRHHGGVALYGLILMALLTSLVVLPRFEAAAASLPLPKKGFVATEQGTNQYYLVN